MPPKKGKSHGKKSKIVKKKKQDSSSSSSEESEASGRSDSTVEDTTSSESSDTEESGSSVSADGYKETVKSKNRSPKKPVKVIEKQDSTDYSSDENDDDDSQDSEGDDGQAEHNLQESNIDVEVQNTSPSSLTAGGKVRQRNVHWTKEERYAVFSTCFKHQDVLKKKGSDPQGLKVDAWQKVLDALNSVEDRGRTMKEMRKQINDYFYRTKKKNKAFLKRLKKNKKVKGCSPVEILVLKWKDHEVIVGPKGTMVYHDAKSKKDKKGKSTVVSKKVKNTPPKPKKSSKSPKKVDVDQESEDNKVQRKVSSKKQTKKESKGTTPRKTIRNRITLPDLDDDTSTYIKGQLFQSMKSLPKMDSLPDLSSGDDDLKVTFDSTSVDATGSKPPFQLKEEPNTHYVDLTIGHPSTSSTPKEDIKEVPRRSPRNVNKNEKIGKTGPKSPGSAENAAKKSLQFDSNVKKDEPAASSSNKDSSNYNTMPPEAEDISMRVARLESLISSMEVERRAAEKHSIEADYKRLELTGRVASLLERCASDRETLLKGFNYAVTNQNNIIRVMASLTYLVAGATKTSDKSCQTPPCPELLSQPLILEQVQDHGDVINVKVVPRAEVTDQTVRISEDGNVVVSPLIHESMASPQAVDLSIATGLNVADKGFAVNVINPCNEAHEDESTSPINEVPVACHEDQVTVAISPIVAPELSQEAIESCAVQVLAVLHLADTKGLVPETSANPEVKSDQSVEVERKTEPIMQPVAKTDSETDEDIPKKPAKKKYKKGADDDLSDEEEAGKVAGKSKAKSGKKTNFTKRKTRRH